MLLQDAGRMKIANWIFQAVFHCLCFSFVGYRADDVGRLHDLMNRHADGLLRYIGKGRKPSLTPLLFSAGLIELHNNIRSSGIEISRRIIKSKMTILPDSAETNIDGMLLYQGS